MAQDKVSEDDPPTEERLAYIAVCLKELRQSKEDQTTYLESQCEEKMQRRAEKNACVEELESRLENLRQLRVPEKEQLGGTDDDDAIYEDLRAKLRAHEQSTREMLREVFEEHRQLHEKHRQELLDMISSKAK